MSADPERQILFSAGDCAVCADSGALLLLQARDSGRLFIFCPLCEVAWSEPPAPWTLDTVFELSHFAPQGARLPLAEDARRSGFDLKEVSLSDWCWCSPLADLLAP